MKLTRDKTLKISKSEWQKIGSDKKWFQKESMAVWMKDEIDEKLRGESWFVNLFGEKTPPEIGIRELGPEFLFELPKMYKVRPQDIKNINGRDYIVLDVEKDKKKSKAQVKVMDIETGRLDSFDKDEVLPTLEKSVEAVRQETLERANEEIKGLNDLLDRLDQATSNITLLPLQLGRLERQIDVRIEDLNGIINHFTEELEKPEPEAMAEWEGGMEEQLAGDSLDERTFIDTLFQAYIYQYDKLAHDLEAGAIPFPSNIETPDILRQKLIEVARLGHKKQSEKRFLENAMSEYSGNYDQLKADLESGAFNIPSDIDTPELREKLKKKVDAAINKEPFDIETFEVPKLKDLVLKDIPKTYKPTSYKSYISYVSSMKHAIEGSKENRDMLLSIKDALARLRMVIGDLPDKSNETIRNTPEGQEVTALLKNVANNELAPFVKRYKSDIIDPKKQTIDPKKFGRAGSVGNASLVASFARLYKVLSTMLSKIQSEEEVTEPVMELEVEEKARDLVPESSNNNLTEKLSKTLWESYKETFGIKE